MKGISLALVLAALTLVYCVDPPVWPATFSQRFVQTYIINNRTSYDVGQHYYDAAHNRSRFDRRNGINASICSSILNEQTECTNLIVGGKRYILFPQKAYGCFCCDGAHGCGILSQNWLSGATYIGIENLLGQDFHKWSKPDGGDLDYYYATTDSTRIPRRLDEAGEHILDYLMNTYSTQPIPDSVFEIPSYVKGDCPATSKCAKFRQGQLYED